MKRYLFQLSAVAITVIFVGGVFWYTSKTAEPITNRVETAKQVTLDVIDSGIDFSNSLYPIEDQDPIRARLQDARDKIVNDAVFTEQHIFGTASWYFTAKDYDKALKLYEAADLIEASDMNYRINRAIINMKRSNLDPAITELQLLTTDWPIPETFMTLADAYKLLPDTPNYVIDEIYEMGLSTQVNRTFDLLEATINWYEKSGRPKEAIEYYESIIKLVPDASGYEARLSEIKTQ